MLCFMCVYISGVLNAVLSQGTTSVTLDNIDDANNSQTDTSDAINNDVLQNCFAALVNTLSTQNPKYVWRGGVHVNSIFININLLQWSNPIVSIPGS